MIDALARNVEESLAAQAGPTSRSTAQTCV